VFDFDHITALWFVTSPLDIPCVILISFCLDCTKLNE
jgi:hypothetical protein